MKTVSDCCGAELGNFQNIVDWCEMCDHPCTPVDSQNSKMKSIAYDIVGAFASGGFLDEKVTAKGTTDIITTALEQAAQTERAEIIAEAKQGLLNGIAFNGGFSKDFIGGINAVIEVIENRAT